MERERSISNNLLVNLPSWEDQYNTLMHCAHTLIEMADKNPTPQQIKHFANAIKTKARLLAVNRLREHTDKT